MDFVAAFNAHDLDALAGCLAPDATAVVDGSPFPVERGRVEIRETSLTYLTGQDLYARAADHPEAAVLLLDDAGRLDMAVRVEELEGQITSLTYYTMPHRAEVVTRIAEDCGLEVSPGP